jgi:hypothetical protein
MRDEAINDQLEEALELIGILQTEEIAALDKVEVVKLRSPKISNALNCLRICLDYAAHDIEDKLISEANKKGVTLKPKKDVYYPYGKTKKIFDERITEVLTDLKIYLPDVYNLMEKMQPYSQDSTNQWLINFLKINNDTKHFDAEQQLKQKNGTVKIAGGAIVIEKSHNIILNNITVNGVKQDGEFHLGEGEILKKPANWEVEFEALAEFKFKEPDEFILRLLKKTYDGVKEFIDTLYQLLANY